MASIDDILLEVEHPDTLERLFILLPTEECSEVQAAWDLLTDSEIRAGLSTTKPALASLEYWQVDDTCSVTGANPPATTRPQAWGGPFLFEVLGVTTRGFLLFTGVDGAALPAQNDASVFGVAAASDSETLTTALTRTRENSSTPRILRSNMSNIREVTTTPTTPGTLNYDFAGKRWLGPQIYFQNYPNSNGTLITRDEVIVQASLAAGGNFIGASALWGMHEPTPGQYDYRLVDAFMNRAALSNVPVMLRIVTERGGDNAHLFITDDEVMRDESGNIHNFNSARVGSFDSESFWAKTETYIRAIMNRVIANGHQNRLLAVGVLNDGKYEADYPFQTSISGNNVFMLYDYSNASKAKFRSRLNTWYGNSLSSLNSFWGTTYTTWDQVEPPVVDRAEANSPFYLFNTQREMDWYNHRQHSLAEWVNRCAALLKSLAPNTAVFYETGNCWSNGIMRATYAIPALLSNNVNMIKQNDQKDHPFALTSAISQSYGRFAANEFEAPQLNTAQEQEDWAVASFETGCSLVTYANPFWPGGDSSEQGRADAVARINQVYPGILGRTPLNASVPIATQETLTVSMRALVQNTYNNGSPSIRDQHTTLRANNTKRVAITFTNDLQHA